MKKLLLIFLCFCVLIIRFPSILAQNIKTPIDSTILKSCTKIPSLRTEYSLIFTSNHFDLNHENSNKSNSEESIETLIQKIETNPKDYKTAKNLVEYYRKQNNKDKNTYYFNSLYQHVYEDYQNNPNNFETVELFCELLEETQNMDGLFSVWEQFVTDNPQEKRALAIYAIQLALKGDVAKSRSYTQTAYNLDNQNNNVYMAALMSEVTASVMLLVELLDADIDETVKNKQLNAIKIDETFFKKAISSKGPPAVQMSLDAANLLLIYYRTVFATSNQDLGREIIILTPNKEDEKLLKDIEKRALEQIKKKFKNLSFAHKTLCTIRFLRGEEVKATAQWKSAGAILENDIEILRLLSFGYLLKKDFKNAIIFAEKISNNNYVDAFTLGRLYALNNESDKAYDLFTEIMIANNQDIEREVCARICILIQQNKFDKAIEMIEVTPVKDLDNIERVHYNYYKALTTLIRGDKNDAFKRLKAIHPESEYKEGANLLLEHFFEQTKE